MKYILPPARSLAELLLIMFISPLILFAQDTSKIAGDQGLSITRHQRSISGKIVKYTASSGYMPMRDEAGKHKANIFFTAYTRDDVNDITKRPVTFVYNGGPGSASLWLHLGALGPRRVLMGKDGEMLPPPFQVIDNEWSWLDETDLVFIDPVMTGYSRPAPGEEAKQFLGYQEDITSVGDFIRLYTTRYTRWLSPKFLCGESYGTTRSAGLAGYLQDRYNLYINGTMLISSILNFQTARFTPGNDLPYILFLPTYTATAWYHKRLAPELQKDLRATLAECEKFALGEYAQALMLGSKAPEAIRSSVTRQLARFTGLSQQYVEQTNLRIDIMRFTKELLRQERRSVGRLDSRFKGLDRDAAGERFDYDPSLSATISGPFAAAVNDYLRRDLKVKNDLPYEALTGRVQPWNYNNVQNQYLNVAETLRDAMSKNPYLKVWVANGYYDLATPYFATDYTFHHLGIEPMLEKNVTMTYYEAGHMMYIHQPSLQQLKQDVVRFIQSAIPK